MKFVVVNSNFWPGCLLTQVLHKSALKRDLDNTMMVLKPVDDLPATQVLSRVIEIEHCELASFITWLILVS